MNEKLKDFYARAADVIRKLPDQQNLPFVEAGKPSAQRDAWYWYFAQHLGAMPAAFQAMLSGHCKAFTTPTQWPWEFELSLAPPVHIGSAPIPGSRDHSVLTYDELMERARQAPPSQSELEGTDYGTMFRLHGKPIGRFE